MVARGVQIMGKPSLNCSVPRSTSRSSMLFAATYTHQGCVSVTHAVLVVLQRDTCTPHDMNGTLAPVPRRSTRRSIGISILPVSNTD